MKLFRLRFILLGLLLCVFHVWCRTCGSDFTDPASSAYLADVVVEGRVSKLLDPVVGTNFNITVKLRKIRKGVGYLKDGKKTATLIVGDFGQENLQNCVTNITKSSKKYYFFLKRTNSSEYFRISSFPVAVTKKVGRSIRKITCRSCSGKPPVLKKIRVKNTKVGRKLQLRCRIKTARPAAVVFQWKKDGQVLRSNKKKGIQIKSSKKYIRLRIKKASFDDAGVYTCTATNAAGSAQQDARVKVISRKPGKPSKKTTTAAPTTSVPSRYKPCLPQDKDYCLNGGTCKVIVDMGVKTCRCQRSYHGKRCAMRNPVIRDLLENSEPGTERDRTMAIIGIVIGILIFICIFIASYFVAKKRRAQFLKRRDEKRRTANSNSVAKSSPSYQKLSFTTVQVDPESEKIDTCRLFQRQNTINMETQTEETSFIPPNPNTNINLHLSPMDNFYRNPPSQRNSRNRLSGVSTSGDKPAERRPSTENDPSLGREIDGRKGSSTDPSQQTSPKRKSRGSRTDNGEKGDSIPRIRMMSESGSDDENVSFPSLHISEDEQTSLPQPDSESSVKNSSNSENDLEKSCNNNDSEIKTPMANGGSMEFSLSQSSSASSLEKINENHSYNNLSQTRRYSDTLSWNERGSPEQFVQDHGPPVEDPRYIKRPSNDNIYDQYPNSFNFSSDVAVLQDVRDNEPPIHV